MSNQTSAVASISTSAAASTAARRLAQIGQHMGMATQSTTNEKDGQKKGEEKIIKDSGIEDPVLFQSEGGTRIFKLNNPKAYNALNGKMVDLMTPKIKDWDKSNYCKVLLGVGGEKAFCSGGDVKAIALLAMDGKTQEAIDYFKGENELDYLLATFSKPYIVVMDGITMGGGAGLAYGAPLRVATPTTQFAMPETNIGFAPDVGAQFYLTQLDGSIGAYIAVTGQTIYGRAVYELGLATHYVGKESLSGMIEAIKEVGEPTLESLASLLSNYSAPPPSNSSNEVSSKETPDAPSGLVGPVRVLLDQAFSRKTVSEIQVVLQKAIDDGKTPENVKAWAAEQFKVMKGRSPTGMKVALEGFKRAQKQQNLWLQLNDDLAMCQAFLHSPDQEMVRGIKALLIDKPKKAPEWSPSTLDDPKISESTILKEWYNRESSSLLKNAPMMTGNPSTEEIKAKRFTNMFREWGLPSENTIKKYVDGTAKTSGAFALTAKELEDRCINEMTQRMGTGVQDQGRLLIGLREKVAEVVQRKCKVRDGQEGYLQWK